MVQLYSGRELRQAQLRPAQVYTSSVYYFYFLYMQRRGPITEPLMKAIKKQFTYKVWLCCRRRRRHRKSSSSSYFNLVENIQQVETTTAPLHPSISPSPAAQFLHQLLVKPVF